MANKLAERKAHYREYIKDILSLRKYDNTLVHSIETLIMNAYQLGYESGQADAKE